MTQPNWHTATMARFKTLPLESLYFIRDDAAAAAKAGESIGNPKVGQYLDEVHYASMEIAKRQKGVAA